MRNGFNHYADLSPNEQSMFSTRVVAMFDHADVPNHADMASGIR